jgi:hypothetical protein
MEAIRTVIATLKELAAKGARFSTRTILRTDGGRRLVLRKFLPMLLVQLRQAHPHWARRIERDMAELPVLAGDPMPGAQETLSKLARDDKPVIVGPWLGEVGFELLYWVPFLRWVAECEPELARRMTIVSRGGSEPWYAGLGTGYADVFEFITPEEVVAELHGEDEAKQKQLRLSPLDKRLIDAVRKSRDLRGAELLHPSVFFRVFRHLRHEEAIPRLQKVSRYERLPAPEPSEALRALLPDEYVVARFYFSYAFPDTPENRRFVSGALRALAERHNVVLVSLPFQVDDHTDATDDLDERVIRIDHLMEPTTNLAVQTAAIGGATAFFGTYGGFSYLAPFLGVPSLSWYSRADHFNPAHLDLAARIFADPNLGDFAALDVSQASQLSMLGDFSLLASPPVRP